MGVDVKVRAIYEEQIQSVSTEDNWRNVMRLAGQLYRYEFDNILMVYAQRPKATLVADYSGSVVKTKTLGFFNESLAC